MQVLREVCDKVFKEKGVSEPVMLNRAKVSRITAKLATRSLANCILQALLLMGTIFRRAVPDESAEERRELERYVEFCFPGSPRIFKCCNLFSMVADAAAGRSKHGELRAAARAREKARLREEREKAHAAAKSQEVKPTTPPPAEPKVAA
jgi:hypothetical protein